MRPPWEAPLSNGAQDALEIVIDPGQAFGTGAHATTRLCLELLLELVAAQPPDGALLDVGAARACSRSPPRGSASSPCSHSTTTARAFAPPRENARANDVDVDVRRFDLRATSCPGSGLPTRERQRRRACPQALPPYLLTANLLRPLLLELAARLERAPAHLIAGGLLVDEADEVARRVRAPRAAPSGPRRQSGEWAALWLAAELDRGRVW